MSPMDFAANLSGRATAASTNAGSALAQGMNNAANMRYDAAMNQANMYKNLFSSPEIKQAGTKLWDWGTGLFSSASTPPTPAVYNPSSAFYGNEYSPPV